MEATVLKTEVDENGAVLKRILGSALRNRISRRVRDPVFLWLLDTLLAYEILYSELRTRAGRYRMSMRHKNTHLIMGQYLYEANYRVNWPRGGGSAFYIAWFLPQMVCG